MQNVNELNGLNSFIRLGLAASGAESGLRFQTLLSNGTPVLRRLSPAPSALNTCECSIAFDCPDRRTNGGPFRCYHEHNCTAGTVVWNVPGVAGGCTTYEQLLNSDLRCFFDKTCIDTMLSLYDVGMPGRLPLPEAAFHFNVLNTSVTSRYNSTTTIDILFNNLMLEKWTMDYEFEKYYDACAPPICTYTVLKRFEPVNVISLVIAFTGGVVIILRLLLPLLMHCFCWLKAHGCQKRHVANQQFVTLHAASRRSVTKFNMHQKLKNMNVFRSEAATSQLSYSEAIALLSTRVYVILLPICILVLIFSYGLSEQSTFETIYSPSKASFERLQLLYPQSLLCSCTQVAIPLSTFSSLELTSHQVSSLRTV